MSIAIAIAIAVQCNYFDEFDRELNGPGWHGTEFELIIFKWCPNWAGQAIGRTSDKMKAVEDEVATHKASQIDEWLSSERRTR